MPRKKKTMPIKTHESYMVEITGWASSYSVSTNPERRFGEGPYHEHNAITITGVLVEPDKLVGREIRAYLMADRYMSQAVVSDEGYEREPTSVGVLTSRGGRSSYSGFLPHDAFPTILTMMASGKYRYLLLHGLMLRYGTARIKYCRLGEEREE